MLDQKFQDCLGVFEQRPIEISTDDVALDVSFNQIEKAFFDVLAGNPQRPFSAKVNIVSRVNFLRFYPLDQVVRIPITVLVYRPECRREACYDAIL